MTANFDPRPIILEGKHARLEPLDLRHAENLFAHSQDEDLWAFMTRSKFRSPKDTENWIKEALAAVETGEGIPFAIIHKESGKAVGSTRYMDISRSLKALGNRLDLDWQGIPPHGLEH